MSNETLPQAYVVNRLSLCNRNVKQIKNHSLKASDYRNSVIEYHFFYRKFLPICLKKSPPIDGHIIPSERGKETFPLTHMTHYCDIGLCRAMERFCSCDVVTLSHFVIAPYVDLIHKAWSYGKMESHFINTDLHFRFIFVSL